MKAEMTVEKLKSIVSYDHETGIFTRISGYHPSKIGKPIGTNCRGYLAIMIDGVNYRCHRLAWLYMYDSFPAGDLDHINGIRDDNRIQNLRIAKHAENVQNLHAPKKHNKLQVLGVRARNGKFMARIRIDGKEIYLGRFSTVSEASNAYVEAKRKFHAFSTL